MYLDLLDIVRFPAFWSFFLGEKADILHTKGRSRYTCICIFFLSVWLFPTTKCGAGPIVILPVFYDRTTHTLHVFVWYLDLYFFGLDSW